MCEWPNVANVQMSKYPNVKMSKCQKCKNVIYDDNINKDINNNKNNNNNNGVILYYHNIKCACGGLRSSAATATAQPKQWTTYRGRLH